MENGNSDQGHQPSHPPSPEQWGYESHLKEYLLLLANKGVVALESSSKYPDKIELGKTWHATLNNIRKSTRKDGLEKWAFAGVKAEKRGIFLPTVPIEGTADHVTGETMDRMMHWARNGPGIVDFLGDIHSHPKALTDMLDTLGDKLVARFRDKHKLAVEFSAGDYYHLIAWPFLYFMGVTVRDYNLFAFKSKESTGLGVSKEGFPQDQFEKYWYEQFGFKYLGSSQKFGAARVVRMSYDADAQAMNIGIARKHRLVLYQGQENDKLVKIFPR